MHLLFVFEVTAGGNRDKRTRDWSDASLRVASSATADRLLLDGRLAALGLHQFPRAVVRPPWRSSRRPPRLRRASFSWHNATRNVVRDNHAHMIGQFRNTKCAADGGRPQLPASSRPEAEAPLPRDDAAVDEVLLDDSVETGTGAGTSDGRDCRVDAAASSSATTLSESAATPYRASCPVNLRLKRILDTGRTCRNMISSTSKLWLALRPASAPDETHRTQHLRARCLNHSSQARKSWRPQEHVRSGADNSNENHLTRREGNCVKVRVCRSCVSFVRRSCVWLVSVVGVCGFCGVVWCGVCEIENLTFDL